MMRANQRRKEQNDKESKKVDISADGPNVNQIDRSKLKGPKSSKKDQKGGKKNTSPGKSKQTMLGKKENTEK